MQNDAKYFSKTNLINSHEVAKLHHNSFDTIHMYIDLHE